MSIFYRLLYDENYYSHILCHLMKVVFSPVLTIKVVDYNAVILPRTRISLDRKLYILRRMFHSYAPEKKSSIKTILNKFTHPLFIVFSKDKNYFFTTKTIKSLSNRPKIGRSDIEIDHIGPSIRILIDSNSQPES